jgi:ribonuclease HII
MRHHKYDDIDMYKYENDLYDSGVKLIAGVDEAGRGPLAGPVVVASVILDEFDRIPGLFDSKQISEKKREELYKEIIKRCKAYKIIYVSVKDIDNLNIYQATKKGMFEAILGLKIQPEHVLIDAMPMDELKIDHTSIIHGDALSASIAAASILAKVSRDHYMEKMDIKYPNYGFKNHKGYGTKSHIEAIYKYGPSKIHRKTYAPVSDIIQKNRQFQLDLFDDDNEDYNHEEN